MSAATNLAKSPNAVFGILIALELGKPLAGLAERAGMSAHELSRIVDQARSGELRGATASMGSGASMPDYKPASPIPDRKPVAAPAVIRKEHKPMSEPKPTGVGIKPKLDWVAVDLIDVDRAYQRVADEKSVARIVADFRWDHFGAVVLAPQVGGRFTVTDGQHRVAAAVLHPDVTHVPALITSIENQADEAENFLTINKARRAVSTIEIYWAGLAAGDAATIRVRDVLERAGCHACPTAGDYKPGATMAVSAVNRTIERSGEVATVAALKTIRAAWPSDSKALRGTLITALARIHRASNELNRERLIKVLAGKSYAEITAHAESFRKLSGGTADTVIARTICELYNRGLSSNIIYYGEAA